MLKVLLEELRTAQVIPDVLDITVKSNGTQHKGKIVHCLGQLALNHGDIVAIGCSHDDLSAYINSPDLCILRYINLNVGVKGSFRNSSPSE